MLAPLQTELKVAEIRGDPDAARVLSSLQSADANLRWAAGHIRDARARQEKHATIRRLKALPPGEPLEIVERAAHR